LQEILNKINSDGSQIGTNGNYDYITANRLLQFKKAYNSQESVSPKLKEDNSLDRDTLDALKKTKEVHNLTKIKGITWEKPFKQKVSDFFYINFKKPLKNTPEH